MNARIIGVRAFQSSAISVLGQFRLLFRAARALGAKRPEGAIVGLRLWGFRVRVMQEYRNVGGPKCQRTEVAGERLFS